MPVMRSDVELLQLLLDNIDWLQSGLCKLGRTLWFNSIINDDEEERLSFLIRNNKPSFYNPSYPCFPYFYKMKEKQPRIDFLNELIKKYGDANDA